MKKTEVGNPQLSPEVEARFAAIETNQAAILARLEKLDPTPKLEALQPHKIGTFVYSVADQYARYPMTVVGYRDGRILVTSPPDNSERELAIASVVPRERCPRAEPKPSDEMFGNMDPKARAYHEGRRAAEVAAKVTPALPAPPKQRRYFGAQDEIPTWGISGTVDQR
jgi:hypothetical protein